MKNLNKIKMLAIALSVPAVGFCQEQAQKESSSYFSNALFLTLLVTIIVLAIVIVAFSQVFKNVAESDYLTNKFESKNNNSTTAIVTVMILLSSFSMFAQDAAAAAVPVAVKDDGLIGGLDQFTFYFMTVIIFLEMLVLGLIIYQFNFLVKTQTTPVAGTQKVAESKIIKSLTDAVPIEEEASILLDHNYDGIQELDNNLPPWWKYGFYLTIVFAFVYMISYHITGTSALQGKEYENEMAQAKLEVDEYMKKSANNVDENTVVLLTEASDLAAGKDVFKASCAACHGQAGEGTVGPNFADEYWLHGGSVQDIFKSIKYGWVEKGMKSWKEDLSPMQIAQVTSYIKSLKGTNPPNAKAPQGDLYVEGGAAPANDSTAVKADSLNLQVKADSLNAAKK